jgi:ribose 5-phosphate isomerase B
MKIAIAGNRIGEQAAQAAKAILVESGHEIVDMCTDIPDDDYPDMAYAAALAIKEKKADRAILICGSGICMCISANKIPGIMAAACYEPIEAHLARSSLNTNVLCLSGRWFVQGIADKIIREWLNTPFTGSKRQERILRENPGH